MNAEQDAPLTGKTVSHYRILGKIGSGGMGVVYETEDMTSGVTIHHQEDPPPDGPNPFAPVGQGSIDWRRIFQHIELAGAEHIFVEQDRCDQPPLEAIKISFDYLKRLRLG